MNYLALIGHWYDYFLSYLSRTVYLGFSQQGKQNGAFRIKFLSSSIIGVVLIEN